MSRATAGCKFRLNLGCSSIYSASLYFWEVVSNNAKLPHGLAADIESLCRFRNMSHDSCLDRLASGGIGAFQA